MTHNELLEKIKKRNGELCDAIMDADDKLCRPFHAGFSAIRAVVELHKPYPSKPHKPNGVLLCRECTDYSTANWPCSTIQAIEKELE